MRLAPLGFLRELGYLTYTFYNLYTFQFKKLKRFLNITEYKIFLIKSFLINRGVESSTISFINFSILGSNNRFFDKLYDGSWSESSIYIAKIT